MRLYHVTYDYHGSVVRFNPRVPNTMLKKEGRRKRICVAPRVSDCLRLAFKQDYSDRFHVYEVLGSPRGLDTVSPATKVPDWQFGTKEEVWLTKPNIFKHLGIVHFFRVLVRMKKCYLWMEKDFPFVPDEDALSPTEALPWVQFSQRLSEVNKEIQDSMLSYDMVLPPTFQGGSLHGY